MTIPLPPRPLPRGRPARSVRPVPRPTLLPGLRRLWRGRRSLQLGVDPGRAVVLELPDSSVAGLLDLLDGTRSERTVLAEAQRRGIPTADAQALLDTLCEAGLVIGAQTLLPHNLPDPVRRRLAAEAAALALQGVERAGEVGGAPATPAQILRRRTAARVAITGQSRLAEPVALALAQAGVGHVWPVGSGPADPPGGSHPRGSHQDGSHQEGSHQDGSHQDGGQPGGAALPETIARAAPGTRTGPLRHRETTLVVQLGGTGPAALAAAGYSPHRVGHLAVTVRDGTVVVGPLVPPAGRPCLNCLDLHRTDRDPQWPLVAEQLAAGSGPEAEACAAATVLAAAGLVAGEVLAWLDGATPATFGGSIEVTGPGQLRRRSWPPHPGCRCHGATKPPRAIGTADSA